MMAQTINSIDNLISLERGAPTAAAIEEWIVAQVAQILQVERDEIDVRSPLIDYGLESLALLSLTGDLAAWIGRDVPVTLFWDCPTIESIARYLSEEMI